jgi:UDP:flavonoid glycosyltransferase YjiC (YdhE family)
VKVLVAAAPFHGHVAPMMTIAKDLSQRGHDVLFLTGSRFAGAAESAGVRFAALDPQADFDDRHMTRYFPELSEIRPGPDLRIFFWHRVFAGAAGTQYRQIRLLLDDFPAAVILHDTLFFGALPISLQPRDSGRPVTIGIGVLPPMLLSEDVPPFGSGTPYLPGPEGRARNRALNTETLKIYAGMQAKIAEIFAGLGCELPGFIFDCAVTAPDHYLQLTVPGFEYPRSDMPASFRYIGALPQPVTSSYATPAWWPALSAGRPVVVVTQGTLANKDLSELILPTVQALAGLDVMVIAATARPDGPLDFARLLPEVPDNTRVVGYVPFDRLLPLADVLITNGGYGGVHAALHSGLPMVIAGDTEDKPEVAARVQWSGAGIDLRTGRPAPAQIREAVTTVLADPGFRGRAEALNAEFSRFDPLATIASLVQALGEV